MTSLPRGVTPLDFSFKCLCSLADLQDENPRPRVDKPLKSKKIIEYVAKQQINNLFDSNMIDMQSNNNNNNNNDFENNNNSDAESISASSNDSSDLDFFGQKEAAADEAKKEIDMENMEKLEREVFVATAVRLNNNTISDLSSLQNIMSKILVNWQWLAWIDLSFNDITALDVSFTEFPELRLIYLHGNSIENINQIDKLKKVKHLHTLTLHGNPVEMTENYRYHVLSRLPALKSLDFSAVTKQERNLSTRRKFSSKKL